MRARRRPANQPTSTKAKQDAEIILRLTELAQEHPRYGCNRLYTIYERVARETDPYLNFKRFRRLYRAGNLQIARRRRRSRAKFVRGLPVRRSTHPNDIWALDFVSDRLLHGRVFRTLTLLDECSKFAFAVDSAFSYPSISVVRTLEESAREHGYPKYLRVDNGPEFIASALENWTHEHSVELLFIQPGKPTQKRVYRIIQLARSRRTAECESIPYDPRGSRLGRDLAPRLQHDPPTRLARRYDARGVSRALRNYPTAT
jgi:putative transposase